MTIASSVKASRKRRSGCSVRLTSSAGSFESWLGHLAQVEHIVELFFGNAESARELADRTTAAHRLLGQLGRLVVTDDRVQRGGQHGAPLHKLGAAVSRLQALDAALAEVAHSRRQQRDRLEHR